MNSFLTSLGTPVHFHYLRCC